MLLLAEGHLDPVMGACTLFAHLSSNFDVSTELDLFLSDNVLAECRERFQKQKFQNSSHQVVVLSYIVDKLSCRFVFRS